MNATFGRATILLFALAAAAHAAPPSESVATARELYKQGSEALDAKDYKTALDKLTAAWALVQTPVIGVDLARAHLALGHLVDARESALGVMRIAPASDETARSREARDEAAKIAEALAPRIPHVTIKLQGAIPEGTTVKLDGHSIPLAALSVSHQVNPGAHKIEIDTVDGRHLGTSIEVRERETKEAALGPLPEATVNEPTNPRVDANPYAVKEKTAEKPVATTSISPLVWVGGSVAVLGLGFGIVGGAIAMGSASNLSSHCTTMINGKYVCPPQYASDLSTGNTAATLSTVGFIAAGVGVGALVIGVLLSGKHETTAQRGVPRFAPMLGAVNGVSMSVPLGL